MPRPPVPVRFEPLGPGDWPALEALFGPRGASGGCWCMLWRGTRKSFEAAKGEGNRRALRALVRSGPPPGVLGKAGETPVAWCSVAPRADFPALARSRILRPLDEVPVWSISCLYVAREHRGQGLSVRAIAAAARYAGTRGACIVEGYPVEPRQDTVPAVFAWTGLAAAFRAAGFSEAARRSETRPIMRLRVGET